MFSAKVRLVYQRSQVFSEDPIVAVIDSEPGMDEMAHIINTAARRAASL
jgi:hypothetical protein